MNRPHLSDYIDIHTHGSKPVEGLFSVEALMAHEGRLPKKSIGISYTAGIHPWFLDEKNEKQLLGFVIDVAKDPEIIAIGEAGFDRLRGPSIDFQRTAFQEQVNISEKINKPLVVHCVKAWDELLGEHKRLKPSKSWLVHGFRGKKELAGQLLSRGMYLSPWYEFALRKESADLLRTLPKDKLFLETDGSDADIREIYKKVAYDLDLQIDELKTIIFNNFSTFFNI